MEGKKFKYDTGGFMVALVERIVAKEKEAQWKREDYNEKDSVEV